MADRRGGLAAGALGLCLLLTGCANDDGGTGPDNDPTATESATTSPEASETPSPSTGGAASGAACDAIDASALGSETGVEVSEPTSAGSPGKREGCVLFFNDDQSVLRIDLIPRHGTLEQDVEKAKALGTEVPQEVTVAGAPGLLVSSAGEVTQVGLVTHVGERLLQVRLNHFESGGELLEQMESLALASAEQVAAGAA